MVSCSFRTSRSSVLLTRNKTTASLSVWLVCLRCPDVRKSEITDHMMTCGWTGSQCHRSLSEGHPLDLEQLFDLSFDLQAADQLIAEGPQIALMSFSAIPISRRAQQTRRWNRSRQPSETCVFYRAAEARGDVVSADCVGQFLKYFVKGRQVGSHVPHFMRECGVERSSCQESAI